MKRYTTRILSPTERAWRQAARLLRDEPALFLGGVGAALVVALGLLWGAPSGAPGPVVARIPTATPALAVANADALPRAVVAYDAPDGRVLGAIDAGVTYRPLARYGSGWVQIETASSGPVWVRAADLDLPGAALADYAPPQVDIRVVEVVRTVEVVREVPAAQPGPPGALPGPGAPPGATPVPVPAALVPLADPAPAPTVLPPFAPGATAAQLAIPTLPAAPRDCPLVLAPAELAACEAARAAEALRHTAR